MNGRFPCGTVATRRSGFLAVAASAAFALRTPLTCLFVFAPAALLVYIAGHRTTFLAPFSHIERLEKGDSVRLEMPYATFVYRISRHRIVRADDLSVLRSPRHELLELQACHPGFFASHRYIAYALPVRVLPRDGRAYAVGVAQRSYTQSGA